MTRDPIAAMQSLIDELRADLPLPPSRAEYERACAEYFDYRTRDDWDPRVSLELEERAERLRKDLSNGL